MNKLARQERLEKVWMQVVESCLLDGQTVESAIREADETTAEVDTEFRSRFGSMFDEPAFKAGKHV